jgi:hypothetical protein
MARNGIGDFGLIPTIVNEDTVAEDKKCPKCPNLPHMIKTDVSLILPGELGTNAAAKQAGASFQAYECPNCHLIEFYREG